MRSLSARKDGTALVIGAIPPNLKLPPSNRKHLFFCDIIQPQHFDCAAGAPQHIQNQFDYRRFARTIRTDQAHNIALWQSKAISSERDARYI